MPPIDQKDNTLKTRRIASSLALAAAIALGATGCGLIAPQGTLETYAPSDGIDVSLDGVEVRNLLLIADESGENFNVVFGGLNKGTDPVVVSMTFVEGSTEASVDVLLEPGLTSFGNPEGENAPVLVSLPGLKAGATVETYFQVAGGGEDNRQVPVLDGTLAEYRQYVLSPSQLRALTEDENGDEASEPGENTDGVIEAPADEAETTEAQ